MNNFCWGVTVSDGERISEIFKTSRRGHWGYGGVEYRVRRSSRNRKVWFADQAGADIFAVIYGKDRHLAHGRINGFVAALEETLQWLYDNVGKQGRDWHLTQFWGDFLVPGQKSEVPVCFARRDDAVQFSLVWG